MRLNHSLVCIPSVLIVWSFFISDPFACTIFTASTNGRTLVGNNEDWRDPGTNIWVVPASEGKFGRVYFGFGVGLAQGGVNEKGLFFDFAAVSPLPLVPSPGKKPYSGYLVEKLMEECSTVEQALNMLSTFEFPVLSRAQLMLVDRSGASAVVESSGVFRKQGDYQVITNFRQSAAPGNRPSIERFRIAEAMLKSGEVSVERFRDILNATHQEGDSPTQYSTVFDLKSGEIHIYYFHNYLEVATLNVKSELTEGEHSFEISSLFRHIPFAAHAYKAQHRRKERTAIVIDPAVFSELVGTYQLGGGVVLTVSTTEDRKTLQAQILGTPVFPVYPEGELKFFCKAVDMQLAFKKDAAGQVDSLIMTFYGQDVPAKRTK